MTRSTVLLTTLLGALSFGAMAQTTNTGSDTGTDTSTGTGVTSGTGSDQSENAFDTLDTNRDGSLDENEVNAGGGDNDFNTLDNDGDGSVTRDEYDTRRDAGVR